jgi:hypothetical protein
MSSEVETSLAAALSMVRQRQEADIQRCLGIARHGKEKETRRPVTQRDSARRAFKAPWLQPVL